MRAGFAGTPDFAARALAALHEDGYTIPLVLTQPDRPSGRGMTVVHSPVKRYAVAHGLRVEHAIAGNRRTINLHGCQHAGAGLAEYINHLLQAWHRRINHVVRQQYGERLVADQFARHQHCMAEP